MQHRPTVSAIKMPIALQSSDVSTMWQAHPKWPHLPDDVTGLLTPVPGRPALSAVVSAVRGLPLLPVPGRAELVLGLTKPVKGRPDEDMGRTAGDAPPCSGWGTYSGVHKVRYTPTNANRGPLLSWVQQSGCVHCL
jgi:hypothetical protein